MKSDLVHGDSSLEPGIDLQFNALRQEIIKRIELRHQIAAITLTIAGVVMSFGVTTGMIALVYPPLAAFLAAGWIHNNLRIRQLGVYVRDRIEPSVPGLNWEMHRREMDSETRIGALPLNVLSAGGLFLFTQLMTVVLGIVKFEWTSAEWFLLVVDVLSILSVVALLERFRRQRTRYF